MSSIPGAGELIAGKYLLQEELGRGGMGSVYAALHTATGRRFAIKLLNPQLAGDADAEARFFREATLASAINHPAIVEVYDVGRHGVAPYMVMKLLEGENLGDRIKRGALAPDEALAILLPVLDGVAAAHARGIVHRDLKPDNILLAREGNVVRPKILDFGISKLIGADAQTRLTRTGISIGTPLYMSPEQVRGEADIDARADVYALGIILYQALTGTLPYEGNNYADLVLKIVSGGAQRARARNPEVPFGLDSVIARAMATCADDRHPSVAALALDLQQYRAYMPGGIGPRTAKAADAEARASARTNTPFTTQAADARKRSTHVVVAIGLLAVLALGLAWAAARELAPAAGARVHEVEAPAQPTVLTKPAKTPASNPNPNPNPSPNPSPSPSPNPNPNPSPNPSVAAAPRGRPGTAREAAVSPAAPSSKAKKPSAAPGTPAPVERKLGRVPNEILDPFEDPGQ